MARAKAVYVTGEKGRNRVAVYPRGEILYLRWYDAAGKSRVRRLPSRHLARAKQAADHVAAELSRGDLPQTVTVGQLADVYLQRQAEAVEAGALTRATYLNKVRVLTTAIELWGRGRDPNTVGAAEVTAFLRHRKRLGNLCRDRRRGQPLRPRMLQHDVQKLRALFNWAMEQTPPLMRHNPIPKAAVPEPGRPRQVTLTSEEVQQLFAVAPEVHPYAPLLLTLAYETGHRIGSIRQLTWADCDVRRGEFRWRAELDKSEFEHYTPMTATVRAALQAHDTPKPGPVFPSLRGPGSVSLTFVRKLWEALERAAGLEEQPMRGWHSMRRVFANDLSEAPLKVVAALGGWKSVDTLVKVYQQPQQAQLHATLNRYRNGDWRRAS